MFLLPGTQTSITQSPPTKESNFSAQRIMSFTNHGILQLLCLKLLGPSPTKSVFLDYYIKWAKRNKNKQRYFSPL